MWEALLAEAVERIRSFDREGEEAARRAEVVRWRWASAFATFHHPVPLPAREIVRETGVWFDGPDGGSGLSGKLVGLDARGRPVVELLEAGTTWERPDRWWRWTADRLEEVHFRAGEATVALHPLQDGRPVGRVSASAGGDRAVQVWRLGDGAVVRVDAAEAAADGWASGSARTAGADGVRVAVLDGDHREDNRLREDEVLPALRDRLAATARLQPHNRIWDPRVDRLTEPLPEDPMALVPRLVDALEEAITAAVDDLGVAEPVALVVGGRRDEPPVLPPSVLVPGRAHRDRVRATDPDDGAVLRRAVEAARSGDVAAADVVDALDAEALLACRTLSTAMGFGPQALQLRTGEALEALGTALSATLNARSWPGAVGPFLAVVEIGHPYRPRTGLERAADSVDPERLAAFQASMAAERRRRPGKRLARKALTDRGALRELLAGHGLDTHADRLAQAAEVGLLLEAAPAGASRLGGPASLPAGQPWPHAAGDRPLSFLAAIDLAELPAFDGRDRFPEAGTLLFFADLDNDDAEGLVDESGNADGDPARVFLAHEPDPADPPPGAAALAHRPVAFRALLTLPPAAAGLDRYDARAYEAVVHALEELLLDEPQHWVAGHAAGVQGEPPEPGTVLLLQLADDEDLGFGFLDAGTIQFRAPEEALRAGDLRAAFAVADSG